MIYSAAAQDKPSHLYSLAAAAAARTVCGRGIGNSIVTSSQDKDKLSTEQMNLSYPRPGQMWSVGWRSLPGDMELQYTASPVLYLVPASCPLSPGAEADNETGTRASDQYGY